MTGEGVLHTRWEIPTERSLEDVGQIADTRQGSRKVGGTRQGDDLCPSKNSIRQSETVGAKRHQGS